MNRIFIVCILILSSQTIINAQKINTDANVVGHVVCSNEHLAFATIGIKGTTIGTVTDETGHFQLINLPSGEHTIFVSMVGYKTQEHTLSLIQGKTVELKFSLEEDVMKLDEVVVSADRAERKRTEAPVIVNTIAGNIFNSTQSATLGEGLCFSPGLRLENNCQNCGFTQVRMNGMEGPYSQILINSRPVFSGLAGVYGLELIPSNMIEKVEVVRGGGSALYGGNAIAGTINIILKDPKTNSYEGGAMLALTGPGLEGGGEFTPDYSVNFNASVVSDDHKSGLSLYGFTRKRDMFDANDDSFSEYSSLENLTFGARAFHRFGYRDKVAIDFFAIDEDRAGGNMPDYPLHERDIAEAVEHKMKVVGFSAERYFRKYDLLSVFASGQFLNRDSYYGAGQSLGDYGKSIDISYNAGVQYKALFDFFTLVVGIENTGGILNDQKLGYPDLENAVIDFSDSSISYMHAKNTTIANQYSLTTGIFAQYELEINKLKVAAGARYDRYEIRDLALDGETKSGNIFSPRLSFMYELTASLQARISYSQGYRAPQIFDEDLHIETSGSRQVLHKNAPDLRQETSHSLMTSLDFNKPIGSVYTGFLVEAFYTRLDDAFVNEYGTPDEKGTVIYTRVNANGGAVVQGVNMELKLIPIENISFTSGFTLQNSLFDEEQEEFNDRRFYRTPNRYGFFVFDWDFSKNLCFTTTGTYTGSMLVPYFGTENPEGELRRSNKFFDLGIKLSYSIKINGASIEFSGGMKNIFNSYQDDFDYGINRDPAYIYGPLAPRMVYFGLKFGNLLD